MDLLRAMEVFVAVVEGGSHVSAAERLNTSATAVSRSLAALEDQLGARLMHRTTRTSSLTEAGRDFYSRAVLILSDVEAASAAAAGTAVVPGSQLRISAPLSFGVGELSRILPRFMQRYPQVKIDIDLGDRTVDLAAEGIDVALRIARQPATTNVVSRRLVAVPLVVCASPDYLARAGRPSRPADLEHHDTLNYSYLASGDSWPFRNAGGEVELVRIRPKAHANNGDILRDMACQGLGIILQPEFIVRDRLASGALVQLLEGWCLDGYSLYALYLSRRHLQANVRAFIDFMEEELRQRTA